MSRDVVATATRAFVVRELIDQSRWAMAELLHCPDVPELNLVVGRVREAGRVVREGTRPDPDETWMGPAAPLVVVDVLDEQGESLLVAVQVDVLDEWRMVASPACRASGFVTAFGLAFGVARAGHGTVSLDEFGIDSGDGQPGDLLAALAVDLSPEPATYDEAVGRFVDRVPAVRAWPRP